MAHQSTDIVDTASAAGHGTQGPGIDDVTLALITHQATGIVRIRTAINGARGPGMGDAAILLVTHQAADAGAACSRHGDQHALQPQVADLGAGCRLAKQAKGVEIPMDGKVADAVAPAIEDGGEGTVSEQAVAMMVQLAVPNGQPAASVRVEVAVVIVLAVQGDGAVISPGPAAAVIVLVEVQVIHQLIADAAGRRTAGDIGRGPGAGNVAAAGQVVPHIVQFRQAADLDETIAVSIRPAADRNEGQGGGAGIIPRSIGGRDLKGELALGEGIGRQEPAGDLAALAACGEGNGQPVRQGRVGGAGRQVAAAVIDQQQGPGADTDKIAAGGITQIGQAQGGQIQPLHPAQLAVSLDDDVCTVAGVCRQSGQADAGLAAVAAAGCQGAAADCNQVARARLPRQGGRLDGRGIRRRSSHRQHGYVGSAGCLAPDQQVSAAGLHIDGSDGGNQAAAAGDEDGIVRDTGRIAGAMVEAKAAVIVGIAERRVPKPAHCLGIASCRSVENPGIEGAEACLVPGSRQGGAGETGSAGEPFRPVTAAGNTRRFPGGSAEAPAGDETAIGFPTQQAAGLVVITAAAIGITPGIAGDEDTASKGANQPADKVGITLAAGDIARSMAGGDDAACLLAHQSAGPVAAALAAIHHYLGPGGSDAGALAHQAAQTVTAAGAKHPAGGPAGSDDATGLTAHQGAGQVVAVIAMNLARGPDGGDGAG